MVNVLRLQVIGVALFGVACAASAGEVNRCANGRNVVYTDQPCSAGTAARLDVARADTTQVATLAPVATRTATTAPHVTVPVTLGMSWRNVHEALGRPFETITRLEGRTLVEYWVYRAPDATTRVVFQQGRVVGVTMR